MKIMLILGVAAACAVLSFSPVRYSSLIMALICMVGAIIVQWFSLCIVGPTIVQWLSL